MLTPNEKRALDSFPYPRTLESAYEHSTFRNRYNFLGYVRSLIEKGFLEPTKKQIRQMYGITDTLTLYKRSKRDE
jgi:hypothetical protein